MAKTFHVVHNCCTSFFFLSFFFCLRQNTDAALLPTISYPAFAVDDDALYTQTLDKIVRKLRGKYGFKRFLRDGYRTANEDKNRRYYKPAEMKVCTRVFSLYSVLLWIKATVFVSF